MRRLATTALIGLCAASLFVFGVGAESDDSDRYLVRAVFDNGTFVVQAEEVRVAGARVGEVESVDVSREDEIVSLDPEPHAEPGKAIIVMRIDDEAFQDFREDASCIIRPQSLLGEKYIDCAPTQPRAPGSEPPPELEVIEEGELGEGERLLPLEANGKSVDLDILNNIMRRPYRERFTILLNDLGAGLAARGPELGEVIDRANPALRETDRVLAILAEQNQTLAQLARDSDTVLGPLARERAHVAGFIDKAGETAEASAERRADIERQFALLPPTLVELRQVMTELRGFSEQATPVFSDLGEAAPSITGATQALGPLANAAEPALTSLGDAADKAGPDLVASDPVIQDLSRLANATTKPAKSLAALLKSLRERGGNEQLLKALFNLSGSINGFDQYGHLYRTQLLVTNCVDYEPAPTSGCGSNFIAGSSRVAASEREAAVAPDGVLDPATGPAEGFEADRGQPEAGPGDLLPGGGEPNDGFFGDEGRFDGIGANGLPKLPPLQPGGSGGDSLRGADALFRFLMESGP